MKGRIVGLLMAMLLLAPCSRASEPPTSDSLERLKQLGEKLDAGQLSAEESRELLRALIHQAVGAGAPAAPVPQGPSAADKVIAVYGDRNSTKLVIEARKPLVVGAPVYAGPLENEVTLGNLLSRTGDLYYYAASAPGDVPVKQGDPVGTRRTRVLETPQPLRLNVAETYTFQQKGVGEVTAVQEGRAMIDRGTLHEVRERDIYEVRDSSGLRKGFLEIHGIGDLQSSGVLYDRLLERRKRALETSPGDRVVFIGQRKLFALGAFYGMSWGGREEYGSTESAFGAGLVWDLKFKDGWGFEALFGYYGRNLSGKNTDKYTLPGPAAMTVVRELSWSASYIFPVAVKKNFRFPYTISPYLLAGASYYRAKLETREDVSGASTYSRVGGATRTGVAPMVGGGVEFYPARFVRPRLDARWFTGPPTKVFHKVMRADQLFVSASVLTAW